jgi:hypothetical protein
MSSASSRGLQRLSADPSERGSPGSRVKHERARLPTAEGRARAGPQRLIAERERKRLATRPGVRHKRVSQALSGEACGCQVPSKRGLLAQAQARFAQAMSRARAL